MNIIFDLPEANVAYAAFDKSLRQWLDDNERSERLEEFFMLSGRAAAYLQEPLISDPVQNVILNCQLPEAFLFLTNTVDTLLRHKGIIRLQNRMIIYLETVVVELWNLPGAIVYNSDFDLYLHDIKDIPNFLID
jgi:hypothetical protein